MTKKLSNTTQKDSKTDSEGGVKGKAAIKNTKKSSSTTSKVRTTPAKRAKKTGVPSDSIYSLDTWKWNYEDVTKPKNKVVVSLTKRVKHAWEVLRG